MVSIVCLFVFLFDLLLDLSCLPFCSLLCGMPVFLVLLCFFCPSLLLEPLRSCRGTSGSCVSLVSVRACRLERIERARVEKNQSFVTVFTDVRVFCSFLQLFLQDGLRALAETFWEPFLLSLALPGVLLGSFFNIKRAQEV